MNLTITATASGSLTPPTAPSTDTVKNGDFLIGANPPAPLTGDGIDEETTWTFDFTGDPSFPFFSSSLPLTSALLTLTLTPRDVLITTNVVLIEGLAQISTPVIQSLPVGRTSTIHLQLLDFYSSAAILRVITGNASKIPMRYGNDAIISSAKLELTQQVLAFQYAVKFVCGKSKGEVVAPGTYFTAINVHNPTYQAIRFRKKVIVARRAVVGSETKEESPEPDLPPKFINAKLGPDQAFEIDCPDIRQILGNNEAPFLKGFVVIETDIELDVVAVYTAAGTDGQIETLETERVSPRRREVGLPDLVPVPDPKVGFCRRDNQGHLIVTVKNQGPAGAGPSVTKVDFSSGTVSMPTPPLAPGASVDLLFLIPPGCFHPDCSFRITVDAMNQVVESNEANNIASGTCLG